MNKKSLSQQIAEIGAGLKYEDLPEVVIHNSKKFILDLLGNIIASPNRIESSNIMLSTVKELEGRPECTVIGCNYKTSAPMAALANATFGHAFDMDDGHEEGIQHPSVVVFPAALAVAEQKKLSGKDLLLSYVYGTEVTIRLGEAFLGQTFFQGFHTTGTCGVFGAAAACGKLMGLDEEKMAYALGIAGSASSGIIEFKAQGTWSKRFQAGHASMCGVIAAMLAEKGFTGPTTVWDGQDGFIRAYSYKDIWDYSKINDEFGKRWEMKDIYIKVHACCRFGASIADCAIELYRQGIDYREIESILAKVNKYTIKVLTIPEETKFTPKTVVDAQFSLPYVIACGLVKGKESINEFTDETICDPEVLKLARKVKWELDPEAESVYPKYWPSTLEVTMKDGRKFSIHVDHSKGSVENPVTWGEAVDKFRFMTDGALSAEQMDRIIDICSRLETLQTLDELIEIIKK